MSAYTMIMRLNEIIDELYDISDRLAAADKKHLGEHIESVCADLQFDVGEMIDKSEPEIERRR